MTEKDVQCFKTLTTFLCGRSKWRRCSLQLTLQTVGLRCCSGCISAVNCCSKFSVDSLHRRKRRTDRYEGVSGSEPSAVRNPATQTTSDKTATIRIFCQQYPRFLTPSHFQFEQFQSSVFYCCGPLDFKFAAWQPSWPRTESQHFRTSAENILYTQYWRRTMLRVLGIFEYSVTFHFTVQLLITVSWLP